MTEKEIGMEKIVELLREYNMSNKSPYILGDADYYVNGGLYAPQIISKKYGFIKWLVENDKIDLDMIREKLGIPCCVWYVSGRIIAVKDVEDYEQVLMLLSISDTPIEDLISYLK